MSNTQNEFLDKNLEIKQKLIHGKYVKPTELEKFIRKPSNVEFMVRHGLIKPNR